MKSNISKKTAGDDSKEQLQMERLQNVLAQRGVASRRQAAELIAGGGVVVDGVEVLQPGFRVDPLKARITVHGSRLPAARETRRTVLLYKPAGLICSASGSQGESVCDYMRRFFGERLVPVGRLDKESEGLLLMSNDGELIQRISHPRYGHSKRYLVRVAGRLEPYKLTILRSALVLDGYTIRPVEVEVLQQGRDNVHTLRFTLNEGRNRQIRKMCSLAHLVVLDLKRISLGSLTLGELRPGQWRELSTAEVQALLRG